MLSHVLGGHQRRQGNSNEYTAPASTFRPNNYTQYNGYGSVPGQPITANQPNVNVANQIHQNNINMANHHHWYQPPQPAYNYVAPSNSREMRNKAEKQRRDRINSFIGELATLVPIVSRSAKRMDKTSILRLTATHLRIYHTLVKARGLHMDIPKQVDQYVLEQLICDQLGGFMLILTQNGKIVFVSPTVETLLGHLQTDLMGQSLFTVTSPEDHERLRTYLLCERGEIEQGWRKYFNIRIRRAGPKSETPVYESVRMMGVHKQLQPPETNSNSTITSSASTSSLQNTINTDILIFFVKLCRPEPLVDRLVAASKDEYVTRHLIDGRIIGCDQRISLIAGYMTEEIQGHSAFMYMHKDDVRWVMIALRQMYDRGESKGNSCYRLKARNGHFIYLKTFGFLEIDDQGIVESFVCVNILVDEKEGKNQVMQMKKRYSAIFTSSLSNLPASDSEDNDGYSAVPENQNWSSLPPPILQMIETKVDSTEDPVKVEQAVNELMQNLPSPGSDESNQSTVTHSSAQSPAYQPQSGPSTSTQSSMYNIESSNMQHQMSGSVPIAHKGGPSVTASKAPHIRIRPGGKRAPSVSPDHVKRQRLTSVDSEPPQMSPPLMDPQILPYPKGPPSNSASTLNQQYDSPSPPAAPSTMPSASDHLYAHPHHHHNHHQPPHHGAA